MSQPFRGQKLRAELELEEIKERERRGYYEDLDEYPKELCEHCNTGPCHFTMRGRCITRCVFGNEKECPDESAHTLRP